jgi:hypothetical protein
VVEHLLWQADACQSLGSTFYAVLLRHLADDAASDGITARLLLGHVGDLQEDALALRLLGAAHRLALGGEAPSLAAHYPSTGGDGDAQAAAVALPSVLAEHRAFVQDALQVAPQTNEVGRAAGLVGALCHLVAARPLPIRLIEIGASAGLNLRCDQFEIRAEGGGSFGRIGSSALLDQAWRGHLPPMTRSIKIIERSGCDLHPLDPTTADGALTLMSYVWPDQAPRLARLAGALTVAADVPATVERVGAADFLDRVELRPGSWLVVWHSVMWQYLDVSERVAVRRRLEELGSGATDDAPLAHVAFEPRVVAEEQDFLISVHTWPDVGLGSGERIFGKGAPHGIPISWT